MQSDDHDTGQLRGSSSGARDKAAADAYSLDAMTGEPAAVTVHTDAFIAAMRQLAAGVALVTTTDGDRRLGLTATAVCSVSAEPPQILVCVNRGAEAHDPLLSSGIFAVSLLGSAHRELADRFAGRDGVIGQDRFLRGRWGILHTGAPVLEDGLAAFDCRVVDHLTAGTHSVLIGKVEAVRLGEGAAPMVYHDGDYGLVARLGG